MAPIQLFIKLLENQTLTLQFSSHQTLNPQLIKQHIETLTQIPTDIQKLTLNGKFLANSTPVSTQSLNFSTINLTFSLLGGKGGFGSLLRGAATKAGQKKTNNFDACRDMSGRRLRHVNAEKKLEEWKADEDERKLEKIAEDYLKKMVKKGKGGKKEEGAEKYIEKYRVDSARCVEEVERAVRESMAELGVGSKKRKLMEKYISKGNDAKKMKIWMGKRIVGESESESESDSDDSSDGEKSDDENETSVIIDNETKSSDSSKDAGSGFVSSLESDGNHQPPSSSEGSEEEKNIVNADTTVSGCTSSGNHNIGHVSGDNLIGTSSDSEEKSDERTKRSDSDTPNLTEQEGHSECKSVLVDSIVSEPTVFQPLNFDDFQSPTELEVLGLERLKSELQEKGLKCGGTLKERAARLFLLKNTPLDKLPKKLLAKK